jgi:RNA polymerase sigma-70 factor (ECF subfamily)
MDRPVTALGSSDDLAVLMRSVAQGDRAAFRSVYDRTSAKLYGICLRLLGSEAEAQDVLQEAYVTIWRRAVAFDESKAGAITWLSVIARNKAIDRLRQRRVQGEQLDAALDVPDDAPLATVVIEQDEDARRLAHCLDQLEERARAMIRAAFLDGATYPELSRREGVPLGTMKSWIRRGLLRLRGCLEQ